MSDYSIGGGSAKSPTDAYTHVDASYGGADANGSFAQPFATIQAGITAQAAKGAGTVLIADGAYVEDLTMADGVDLKGSTPHGVIVTGSATATDVSFFMENIDFGDDGAGIAFHWTGTAADTLRALLCDFTSTATGGVALVCDNTASTVTLDGCSGTATTGNANEVFQIEQGTVTITHCSFVHEDNTSECVVLEGDAATTFLAHDCAFAGQFGSETTVANPVCTFRDCEFTVGADHAVLVAAGNTVTFEGSNPITSTEAAQDALGGAGTVALASLDAVQFLGTADEIEATLTVTQAGSFLEQSGTVAAAGASPQTDTVALARNMPTVAYVVELTFEATGGGADDVICSVDQGTLAVGGFDIVTTSAAAAAISGNVHWTVKLPTQ